jgi:nucleoside-diphosphate kinase
MKERTLAIIKPDAVKAKASGKIIDRIEQEGFDIISMNKLKITLDKAKEFYAVHKDKPFFKELTEFMSSGPIIVIVLEKENAINAWRTVMGETNPAKAYNGTIRQIFGTNTGLNAVHGSDAPQTARTEIKFFFPEL